MCIIFDDDREWQRLEKQFNAAVSSISWTLYGPPEVPIKWTLKRRLFLHFIIIGCERRLRFLRNLPREGDALVGVIFIAKSILLIIGLAMKRHGLWTTLLRWTSNRHLGVLMKTAF